MTYDEDEAFARALQDSEFAAPSPPPSPQPQHRGGRRHDRGEPSNARPRRPPPPHRASSSKSDGDDDDMLQAVLALSLQESQNTKGKAPAAPPADAECVACSDKITGKAATCPCGHHYCADCLTHLLTASLSGESGSFPPRCCKQRIPSGVLRPAVPGALYTRYEARAKEAAAGPAALYCPASRCAVLIPKDDIHGPSATCRKCGTRICTACRKRAHGGVCTQDAADRELATLKDKEGWKSCPGCKRLVDKTFESCNHVTCLCGSEWCWLCGAGWVPRRCRCAEWDREALDALLRHERREGPRLPPEMMNEVMGDVWHDLEERAGDVWVDLEERALDRAERALDRAWLDEERAWARAERDEERAWANEERAWARAERNREDNARPGFHRWGIDMVRQQMDGGGAWRPDNWNWRDARDAHGHGRDRPWIEGRRNAFEHRRYWGDDRGKDQFGRRR